MITEGGNSEGNKQEGAKVARVEGGQETSLGM